MVEVALREVGRQLAADAQPLVLAQIEGRLAAQRNDDGWKLSAQQFGFLTGDGIRWPRSDLTLGWRNAGDGSRGGGEFSAQRLDLALMAKVASRVPVGQAMRKLLAELDPQGVVRDVAAVRHGALDAPDTYQVKGMLTGLSLAAKASPEAGAVGRPGPRKATIALHATQKGGDAKLPIADGGVELPRVFEHPQAALYPLSASLPWRLE